MLLRTSLLLLLALVSASAGSTRRRLETSSLQYGACFKVKQNDDNADDDGNSYFYNGAYRAAYTQYSSFFLCSFMDDSNNRKSGADLLSDKDCKGPYVTDLTTYFQVATNFAHNYCNSCLNSCRRRLEDQQQQEQVYAVANCDSCASECKTLWDEGSYYNEEDYQCQQVYDQEDGAEMEYYSAPQCNEGRTVTGYFYDDECLFKANHNYDENSDGAFRTVEMMQVDCYNNADMCEELAQMSFLCGSEDGDDDDDDEDSSKICKAASKATRTRTFYHKPWYSKFPFGIVLFVLVLGGAFTFLSYTYYIRHDQRKVPMAVLDGQVDAHRDETPMTGRPPTDAAPTTSDLPPIS